MNKNLWKATVGSLITAIFIYTFCGIFSSFTGVISGLASEASKGINSIGGNAGGLGFFVALDWICKLAMIGGYAWFFMNITKIAEAQSNESDKTNVMDIRLGYILMLASAVLGLIPYINAYGIIPCAALVFGYLKLLGGYKGLSTSATFTETCRAGWDHLRASVVMDIAAALISLLAGIFFQSMSAAIILGCLLAIAAFVIKIIAFTRMIAGWQIVKITGPYED